MRSVQEALIRPPRAVPASTSELGPQVMHGANGITLQREEVKLSNSRNQLIAVSFYRPSEPRPCLLFAHPNASCRVEGLQLRSWAVHALDCCLVAFDFAGCGESEGAFITLGSHERDDLRVVIAWVLEQREVTDVILYGRSMGSVAALLVASEPDADMAFLGRVKGVIADAPFASVRDLCLEHARSQNSIVRCLAKPGVRVLRSSVRRKAGVDIFDAHAQPITLVAQATMPALFLSAKQDQVCFASHQHQLYAAYGGPKEMVEFDGTHNDCRPACAWDAMTRFACGVLGGDRAPPATGLTDNAQVLCHVSMFVVRNGRFVYDMSLPSPMSVFVGTRELVASDPFAPAEGPLVVPFNSIRSLDAPQDGVMRLALGENDGIIFSCTDALQLMARTDAAINQLLRDQIANDRPAIMTKVRTAAAVMLRRGNAVEDVAQMVEQVLFQEVLSELDAATRESMSRDILATVQEAAREASAAAAAAGAQ